MRMDLSDSMRVLPVEAQGGGSTQIIVLSKGIAGSSFWVGKQTNKQQQAAG